MILPSPSAMVSSTDSVLARFGPLQPASILAALAGTTAKTTAAIAAAPSNLLSMLRFHFLFFLNRNQRHCRNLRNDFSPIPAQFRNEFHAIEMRSPPHATRECATALFHYGLVRNRDPQLSLTPIDEPPHVPSSRRSCTSR